MIDPVENHIQCIPQADIPHMSMCVNIYYHIWYHHKWLLLSYLMKHILEDFFFFCLNQAWLYKKEHWGSYDIKSHMHRKLSFWQILMFKFGGLNHMWVAIFFGYTIDTSFDAKTRIWSLSNIGHHGSLLLWETTHVFWT